MQSKYHTRVANVCPMDPRAIRYPKPRDLSSTGMTWANIWKMVGKPGNRQNQNDRISVNKFK